MQATSAQLQRIADAQDELAAALSAAGRPAVVTAESQADPATGHHTHRIGVSVDISETLNGDSWFDLSNWAQHKGHTEHQKRMQAHYQSLIDSGTNKG